MIKRKPPKVRLSRPDGRPIQVVYKCPLEDKIIRISTGTYDEKEAEETRKDVEANLRLGITPQSKRPRKTDAMPWPDFRERYTTGMLHNNREKSSIDAESRLDIAERILKPRTLRDVATSEALYELQSKLLAGAESRFERRRSKATVRGYMGAVVASLNWAHRQGWIKSPVQIEIVSTDDHMKGRPLDDSEFDKMLKAVPKVVGKDGAASWKFMLNGVVNSGLRLTELMTISWDIEQTIRPVWPESGLPYLEFPGHAQKNGKTQDTPLGPWLEEQLMSVPECGRTGYVFNPPSLEATVGREYRGERLTAERVGKIVTRIGKKAGIVVDEGDPRIGKPKKFASTHDLRRTFAQRLAEAGLPLELTQKLMRHADRKTTERYYLKQNVQKDAEQIREILTASKPDLRVAG
jgi:integrase